MKRMIKRSPIPAVREKDAFWRPFGIKKAHHRWALAL